MMVLLLAHTTAIASCNWKTDVIKKENYYAYSKGCHKEVGKALVDLDDYKIQEEKLRETIKLKDLALDTADKRIMGWREETYNQHSILESHAKMRRYENYLYFSGGIALTVLSIWAAGQISK